MQITLNGEARDVTAGTTVRALVESLRVKPEMTAVQLNDCILPREDFAATQVSEGDVVEVIRVVGGG